ncbi:hypothetical protein LEM8419_00667 [Neolewinella maritima]|uniref:Apea-like HEPN domain-containing protein n=1 Tax=Neolewinella maritima TaxID=1383882 RepID=A0ABM9AXB8_9BACT|nr:hypothetical protein [Neolewinella maritima]CAH0999369.1 hypothetical protein LEM8419_00667 [Neolewinella maritima]
MPNQFFGHINKWLLLSQSDTDFASLFVRAWIPFNAWYVNHYQITRDRECIDNLKSDNNHFRSRMIALLQTNDDAAQEFKYYLAKLQRRLDMYPIPDAVNPISLRSIYYRENPIMSTTPVVENRGRLYKAEKLAGGDITLQILNKNNNNNTVYSYSHNKYEPTHFLNSLAHSNLSNNQRGVAERCYLEINPKVKENLIADGNRNVLRIHTINLINNPNLVSQAVIELLYTLRNKLFHGEIQPTRQNLSVYEPAYFILRSLLKDIQ